eukprot:11654556-Alexandrium_andersonii.AAC.1
MCKCSDSLPVRPTRPFPAPIGVNCSHGKPPAISNKAFGGMLSTSFRSTAPLRQATHVVGQPICLGPPADDRVRQTR